MMPNNRLWLLISRRLSGEASAAELEELGTFLELYPEKNELVGILHSYFEARPAETQESLFMDPDLEERFMSMSLKVPVNGPGNKGRIIPFKKALYAAAVVAGILLLGGGSYFLSGRSAGPAKPRSLAGNEVIARPGARTRLVLPDGTLVWLNSGSKLNYQPDFNTRSREVVLEGEAFFDVVKNPAHPFIVHAASLDIKVLGTSFTVKSYPQDETIETTLLHGAIEVTRQDNPSTPRVILKPNEKLIFSKHLPLSSAPAPTMGPAGLSAPAATPGISVSPIAKNIPDSDKVETSWMYNKLVFNGDSFKELAQKMERWYNVRITLEDEGLNKYRFGGEFDNETVKEALNALQLTAKFTYIIKGNEIELYEK